MPKVAQREGDRCQDCPKVNLVATGLIQRHYMEYHATRDLPAKRIQRRCNGDESTRTQPLKTGQSFQVIPAASILRLHVARRAGPRSPTPPEDLFSADEAPRNNHRINPRVIQATRVRSVAGVPTRIEAGQTVHTERLGNHGPLAATGFRDVLSVISTLGADHDGNLRGCIDSDT